MEEYAGGRINHKGKKIHKKLNTKKGRKVLFDLNNQRQRDIYGQAKAAGKTIDKDPKFMVEVLQSEYDWADITEDQIIEHIDKLKSEEPLD